MSILNRTRHSLTSFDSKFLQAIILFEYSYWSHTQYYSTQALLAAKLPLSFDEFSVSQFNSVTVQREKLESSRLCNRATELPASTC